MMENKQDNSIKIVLIFLALASIAVVGWVIYFDNSPDQVENVNQNISGKEDPSAAKPVTPQVVRQNEEENSNLRELSQTIPHYEEAEKIESYTLKYPNSTQVQDVYRFYSSKNMDENLSFYTDWAGKNEWTVENSIKEKDIYSLYLIKADRTLVVKISSAGEKIKVSLDFLTSSN